MNSFVYRSQQKIVTDYLTNNAKPEKNLNYVTTKS